MSKIKMLTNTVLKAICCVCLFVLIFIGNALLFWYVSESTAFMVFSLFVSLIIIVLFICYAHPYIFKDYIDYFYKKEETKNVEEKKRESTSS